MAADSSFSSVSDAVDSIHRSLSELCVSDHNQNSRRHRFSFDVEARFSAFARRLQLAINLLLRSSPSPADFPPSVSTALKGIAADLVKALETVSVYRSRSKIFVLINCLSLCASLQERTSAISGWLALLDSALVDVPDLRKKVADLARDMKQARFEVRLC